LRTIRAWVRFTTYVSPGYSAGMARFSALRPPSFKLPVPWSVAILGLLLVLIQYPLWLGKGGWLRVADLDSKLRVQQTVNTKLMARNQALSGEVSDLKNGLMAIEERARNELDLIRPDELFVSILGTATPSTVSTSVARAAR
jgi:cell division protein FtsB